MLANKSKTAIIAGKGDLVTSYIDIIKSKNTNFIVIAIDNFFSCEKYKPNFLLNFNNIGNIFNILYEQGVTDVVFLGALTKPSILKLRPNLNTLYYLFLIILHYFKGDNCLLSRIHNIFNNKGFTIVDSRKLLTYYLAKTKNNNLHLFKNKINLSQIKKYFKLTKNFGKSDKGQAIIVSGNNIILTENKNGTDELILRYKKLNRKKEFSILIKTTKPNQNLYFDIPTIGPDTILNLYKAKIKGLVVEYNKTYIAKPKRTFNLINKYKLLYYAI